MIDKIDKIVNILGEHFEEVYINESNGSVDFLMKNKDQMLSVLYEPYILEMFEAEILAECIKKTALGYRYVKKYTIKISKNKSNPKSRRIIDDSLFEI